MALTACTASLGQMIPRLAEADSSGSGGTKSIFYTLAVLAGFSYKLTLPTSTPNLVETFDTLAFSKIAT